MIDGKLVLHFFMAHWVIFFFMLIILTHTANFAQFVKAEFLVLFDIIFPVMVKSMKVD